MKVSVSLPIEDVEFLDAFVRERGLDSRSAALQQAVRVLRTGELSAAYQGAWEEWRSSEDADLWDRTSKDGFHR
jgi:Arc/MetJ-type ribon-helix-helix transcriptional regulator